MAEVRGLQVWGDEKERCRAKVFARLMVTQSHSGHWTNSPKGIRHLAQGCPRQRATLGIHNIEFYPERVAPRGRRCQRLYPPHPQCSVTPDKHRRWQRRPRGLAIASQTKMPVTEPFQGTSTCWDTNPG